MTTHLLSALMVGKFIGHTEALVLGSTIIDFDHIYDIVKHWKKYGIKKAIEALLIAEPEENDQRTVFHSLLGWLAVSFIIYLFNPEFGTYFSIGYLLHLMLDSLDTSKLHLFYPSKYDMRGVVEYNSMMEYLLGIGMFLVYLFY
jgi:membrane-bound metal-dependent hydrolase YbcI (DUF457 family)